MVLKTATYSGMNLKGEIRESISLDEDDLSDVEDEVFIRDGKHGFKLAEELNVKRPLMAPRRKPGKHSSGLRLKQKPSCRAWCKPCCYVVASLSILIGLIVLVGVLVSIYPLPLDKLRSWISSRTTHSAKPRGHLPCTNLKITDVWTLNLPFVKTESPVRSTDINKDGIDDVIFGFRTRANDNLLPPDVFCKMIFGISSPCDGGVMALDGRTGNILWRRWLNDSVFSVHCSADVNSDSVKDCLVSGIDGMLGVVDAKTGADIWKINKGKMKVFVANFVQDQNGDNVSDVVASYSSLEEKSGGSIILLNGVNGQELKKSRTPHGLKSFYMPQILRPNSTSPMLLVGTGTPTTPGNLSIIPLRDLEELENKSSTLYEDQFRGMLTQSVLVDITGDRFPDIITSMYNSSVVAINGKSSKQIWKYNLPNSITDMSPTPGFFNNDNVTDFMVTYQKYDSIFKYNYTQTLIIDGLTGQAIYQPISGGIITQMSGLTLSMEGNGHDIYLFWTSECSNTDTNLDKTPKTEQSRNVDECKRQFNSSTVLKLNALNEYHQPPGITIYESTSHEDFEFTGIRSPTKLLREYLKTLPGFDLGFEEQVKQYNGDPGPIEIRKYGSSSFRHKDRPGGIVKDYGAVGQSSNDPTIVLPDEPRRPDQQPMDYNIWMPVQEDNEPEFSYLGEDNIPYSQKQPLMDEVNAKMQLQQENLRSKKKTQKDGAKAAQSKKKNLSDKIFGYHNVRLSKDRLLHDEEALPTEILKDTFFKNEENRLKMMKLEQRDVNSHVVGEMDDRDIKKIIEKQKNDAMQNRSTTLWDLETENEMGEREERGFRRKKRSGSNQRLVWESLSKVTSVGAVLKPFDVPINVSNVIDVVFIKFWEQTGDLSLEALKTKWIQECVEEKISQVSDTNMEQTTRFQKECQTEQETLRRNFPLFDQLAQLTLGQTTVYRIRIRCDCDSTYNKQIKERCVEFLPNELQGWPEYMGRNGDGVFGS